MKKTAAKKKTARKKTGRPTKWKDEFCSLVVEMGREGKSLTQMACAMDITEETLAQWRKNNLPFSEAIKKALQHSHAWWDQLGQEGAKGDIEGFNSGAFVWQTKNRFPSKYRDKHEISHDVTGEISIVIGGAIDED